MHPHAAAAPALQWLRAPGPRDYGELAWILPYLLCCPILLAVIRCWCARQPSVAAGPSVPVRVPAPARCALVAQPLAPSHRSRLPSPGQPLASARGAPCLLVVSF